MTARDRIECRTCLIGKTLDDFYRRPRSDGSLRVVQPCRECTLVDDPEMLATAARYLDGGGWS